MSTEDQKKPIQQRGRESEDIQFFPGVGPQRAVLLKRLGISRPVDLLFHFPRSYQDVAPICSSLQLQPDVRASVLGVIEAMDMRVQEDGRSVLGVLVRIDGGGYLRIVWFNQPFRRSQLSHGMRVLVTGMPRRAGMTWEMRHPDLLMLSENETIPQARPEPIYPLTEGLLNHHLRKMIGHAIDRFRGAIEEALPESLRERFQLLDIRTAIEKIHQPESMEEAMAARRRFIYQELLIYQLALAQRRYRTQHHHPAPQLECTPQVHARILRRIPYTLTQDQLLVVEEIKSDLQRDVPMNRLLQGDVGSGKTVVAMFAMLVAVANRYQVALMAPTELLARQHAGRFRETLRDSQVAIEFLSGSLTASERLASAERIAQGDVDIVIGTQALLSDKIRFAKLGLVVIDEQHRFGVQQRASLRDATTQPHYLVLSATPIPRTLAMTAFGDLDVSVIRQKPTGEVPLHTYLGQNDQFESWWRFVIGQVQQGRQAYVVAARVSQEEESNLLGAEQVFQVLQQGPLKDLRLALLHGRMDGNEKQSVLSAFESGAIDVLVSTTVVEVGIDVPNATVMTILDADRLGLAQLHQLRGRVSRGTFPGYVCLFPSKESAPEDQARIQALTATTDGFALAEMDLQMRGPGNLLGTQQHGLPKLRIADLARDAEIIAELRLEARRIIDSNPNLEGEDWKRLSKQVRERHGDMLTFGDVG